MYELMRLEVCDDDDDAGGQPVCNENFGDKTMHACYSTEGRMRLPRAAKLRSGRLGWSELSGEQIAGAANCLDRVDELRKIRELSPKAADMHVETAVKRIERSLKHAQDKLFTF